MKLRTIFCLAAGMAFLGTGALADPVQDTVQNNFDKNIHIYFSNDATWAKVKYRDQIKPMNVPKEEGKIYIPPAKYLIISMGPNTEPLFGARTSYDNSEMLMSGCTYTVAKKDGGIGMESTPANACPILFAPITPPIPPAARPIPPATSRELVIDPSERGQGHQDIYSSAPAN